MSLAVLGLLALGLTGCTGPESKAQPIIQPAQEDPSVALKEGRNKAGLALVHPSGPAAGAASGQAPGSAPGAHPAAAPVPGGAVPSRPVPGTMPASPVGAAGAAGSPAAPPQESPAGQPPSKEQEIKDKAVIEKLKAMSKKDLPKQGLKIAPASSPDWKPSSRKASEIGKAMDASMKKLPPVFVNGRVTFDTKEGTLVGKPQLRVGDKGRFNLEYFMPGFEGQLLRYVSDGRRVGAFDGTKWRPAAKGGGPLTPAEIQAWPRSFSRTMLAGVAEGRSVFEPLFKSWSSSPTFTIQEKTQTIHGKSIPIYRVLASDGKTTREVLIDGGMWLPITIRSEAPLPGGKKEALMWTGQWAFGGRHEEKFFTVPPIKP